VIEREQVSQERAVTPETTSQDQVQFENTLRPKTLEEYIGQAEIKQNLHITMQAAQKREEPLEHVLLHGPPGLGKTTLAHIIGRGMGAQVKVTSGPAIEKQGDLASILTNLKDGDLLFIDEIHRLRPVIEEVLYSAMEDFVIDIMLGKGPSARSVRLNLPRFTLIGATTKMSMLSSPLRDRFGNVYKFQFYEVSDIREIIVRSAQILECEIQEDAALLLAQCSRQTPRIANRLLKRARDFAEVHDHKAISLQLAQKSLDSLGVDALGLDSTDRDILKTMIEKFNGGPVGLNTISSALSEEQATIEDIYEPYLIQLGFIDRTPRGRIATDRAFQHLGFSIPSKPQHKLL